MTCGGVQRPASSPERRGGRGRIDMWALAPLTPEACHRAVESRDRRFDGRFVVAITTTRVYCRPSCPSRPAHAHHRRFFDTAAFAQSLGYRPCRRCRPRAASAESVDAVSHLANTAVRRIADGALNGGSVHDLAADLGVSARHLRRCLQHELGASPLELAVAHRLLLAQRLLAQTRQTVSRVAYASGFQSLRRFNAAFRERFETTPGAWRSEASARDGVPDALTLSLGCSAPFAWEPLLLRLREGAVPGVELVTGGEYGTTVRLEGHAGHVLARHDPRAQVIEVDVSASLAPVLVPLVARLRRVFDLDARPEVIDGHLEASGLGHLMRRRPGIRLPGAVDGFRAATVAFLSRGGADREGARELAGGLARVLGGRVSTGIPGLEWLTPDAGTVLEAGERGLRVLGLPADAARALVSLSRMLADGTLSLEPGDEPAALFDNLASISRDEVAITDVIVRTLGWPDAFAPSDVALQRATGFSGDRLERLARTWRPWRAYASEYLRLAARDA